MIELKRDNFILNDEDFTAMMNTNHHCCGKMSKYHREGSVLRHTSMVLEKMLDFTDDKLLITAAQLHDVGKPTVFKIDGDKVRFFGHEGVSAYKSIEYADKLDLDKKELFKLVALHGILYKYPKLEMINKSFTPEFWSKLSKLIKADSLGRIPERREKIVMGLLKTSPNKIEDSDYIKKDKNITLLIGPPGSGKTSYIKNNLKDFKVISRDDMVLEVSGKSSYKEAFEFLNKRDLQRKVDTLLTRKYSKYISNGDNIVIDMTNMGTKSRRRWTNGLSRKGYSINYIMILTGYNELLERNKSRGDKQLPEKVIKTFMSNLVFPIKFKEEFDTLTLV